MANFERNVFLFLILTGCTHLGGPPTKYEYASNTKITKEIIGTCVDSSDLGGKYSSRIDPHSRGGFNVEIVGKDLFFSDNRQGLWERIGFFIDVEQFSDRVRVQFVKLRGQSTYSKSAKLPPSGDRWKPFDEQEQALFENRSDRVFKHIGDCIKNGGVIA